MDIQITITAPELAGAINRLADALNPRTLPAPVLAPVTVQSVAPQAFPVSQAPLQQSPVIPPQAPVQQQQPAPAYNPPAVPVAIPQAQQAAPAQMPVQQQAPTTAPTYQLPDLMRAASDVAGASPEKRGQVLALINSFGAQAMNQIPVERYGEFAAALRGMGAKL